MVNARLSGRARQLMRADALDVAEAIVLDRGYRGVNMQEVADRVGVARQTLYSEFGSKQGLASALVLRLTGQFLDGIERALAAHPEMRAAWWAAARYTFDAAADNPLLKAVLVGDGSGELLPLLTSEAAPVVREATERLVTGVCRRWPGLDHAEVGVAAEAATRLALSHLVLPLHPPDVVAEHIAELVVRFLGHQG
ncbi:TetR family transcriptional regulator [Amycolatopsis echigonensis]|uniref:TetR family transcriptional regulator n=2 Tax=Amycolatopsis TaxID=1813 RepID=A0A2N3WF83_9PSEU|nr:TetR family transcriptional regulator [Amycolatopsis niigatensis]GHG81539.1 TetR family transcriptional regulator [Amycolatopsis acidiphila]